MVFDKRARQAVENKYGVITDKVDNLIMKVKASTRVLEKLKSKRNEIKILEIIIPEIGELLLFFFPNISGNNPSIEADIGICP